MIRQHTGMMWRGFPRWNWWEVGECGEQSERNSLESRSPGILGDGEQEQNRVGLSYNDTRRGELGEVIKEGRVGQGKQFVTQIAVQVRKWSIGQEGGTHGFCCSLVCMRTHLVWILG